MTTVDAVNGADTLGREEISAKQVAVADRLVLTKTDLAGSSQSALMRRIRALNAAAPVLTSQHGRVEGLFGDLLYDTLTKSLDVQSWLEAHAARDEHGHGSPHVQSPHDVETYAIVRREPIPAVALTLFLRRFPSIAAPISFGSKGS